MRASQEGECFLYLGYILNLRKTKSLCLELTVSKFDYVNTALDFWCLLSEVPFVSYSIICKEIRAKESEEEKGNDFHSKEVKNKGELW